MIGILTPKQRMPGKKNAHMISFVVNELIDKIATDSELYISMRQ